MLKVCQRRAARAVCICVWGGEGNAAGECDKMSVDLCAANSHTHTHAGALFCMFCQSERGSERMKPTPTAVLNELKWLWKLQYGVGKRGYMLEWGEQGWERCGGEAAHCLLVRFDWHLTWRQAAAHWWQRQTLNWTVSHVAHTHTYTRIYPCIHIRTHTHSPSHASFNNFAIGANFAYY